MNFNFSSSLALLGSMDVPNELFYLNKDWDPSYLQDIFSQDFFDFGDMWSSNVTDSELVQECERVEKYCPIMEDISLDDSTLCQAVESIEEEEK